MTEIALIWDRPILFEKLFVEYGVACERVSPLQIGTAYSPKFKVAVLPGGFGNPSYSTVAKLVKSLGTPLKHFVRKGGVLIAFSPFVDGYGFNWLGLPYRFTQCIRDELQKLSVRMQHPAVSILDELEAHTDGYFTETGDNDEILRSADGAVLVVNEMGEGNVILSSIHEFPARRFIAWALDIAHL